MNIADIMEREINEATQKALAEHDEREDRRVYRRINRRSRLAAFAASILIIIITASLVAWIITEIWK